MNDAGATDMDAANKGSDEGVMDNVALYENERDVGAVNTESSFAGHDFGGSDCLE